MFFQIMAPDFARACSCIADPYSKTYQLYKKTWYGTQRKWSCVYTCQDSQQKRTEVTGYHSDWYVTDKGLEGICDGLHYVNIYNAHRGDFVWKFEEARWFNPAQSTSADLKKWSQSCR
ncbi:hypothetical protein AB1A81_12050 [Bdellovibrio bacteriovorus]|nr:hypothetical protein [Bdellovibrio bacteriovorus]AHZ85124.1 hypothetical protein EP01_09265 [Bdellovibrio bacteriovorus]BEV69014.1 hypothetical protein Bb109J_c2434 [Bdellovibrio bacteriovorus]